MNKIRIIIVFFFLITNNINAQKKEHLSGFSTLVLIYKFNPKWYAYSEIQARSITDFSTIDYYEFKGGAGYNFNKSHQLFGGLGHYTSYTEHKISKEEFRFWLQYAYTKFISRIRIEQRIRFEKRFFNDLVTGNNTNTERYRYRINTLLPLNNEKVEAKTFFINAYDEIFLITEKPTLTRNRVFGGIGYQATKTFSTTLGYLWQRDFGLNKNNNTHFLYCGINIVFDKSNKTDVNHLITPNAD